MGKKRKQPPVQRADLRGGKFIGLPTAVKESEAYRALSAFAKALLPEFIAAWNGYNNGKIVLSQRQIAECMNTSNYRLIGRSIAKLIEHGFLDISTASVWQARKAREYRLTFISTGSPPNIIPATNEYQKWKNDADDVSAERPQSADPVSASVKVSAEALSAGIGKEPQKPVRGASFTADTGSSLISKPLVAVSDGLTDTPVSYPEMRAADLRAELDTLRDWVGSAIARLGYGGARTLANDADIPEGTLSRFRSGKSLPDRYRVPLQEACARVIPFNKLAA